MRIALYFILIFTIFGMCASRKLRVMTFNIWNAGSHVSNGIQKVAKHIMLVDPDIVALQEARRNEVEPILLSLLGYPWKGIFGDSPYSDVAILTKHKLMTETSTQTGRSIGVQIDLGSGDLVIAWSVHLDYKSYGPYAANNKLVTSVEQILAGEMPQHGAGRMQNMLEIKDDPQMKQWLNKSDKVPVILAGDFNSPSHIDWTEETIEKHGNWTVEWPATKVAEEMSFIDSFRTIHPNVTEVPGNTWSTVNKFLAEWEFKIPEPQDRIDYIFFKGNMVPVESFLYEGSDSVKPIPHHGENDYPSDHFAVVTDFEMEKCD